jgi:hypothetical protein
MDDESVKLTDIEVIQAARLIRMLEAMPSYLDKQERRDDDPPQRGACR